MAKFLPDEDIEAIAKAVADKLKEILDAIPQKVTDQLTEDSRQYNKGLRKREKNKGIKVE